MSTDNLTPERIRNLAIVAHVDHGKTTLVDKMLHASGALGARAAEPERIMDSNDQEKERGITILAKNTAMEWEGHLLNIVDTPGHADFGGEVERILSMVDAVLLLVDAVDGPMPQTRFVTTQAFRHGLKPIVVINKIDRDGARPDWVLSQTFDLFDNLGATDEQLDFPVVYTSAINGLASLEYPLTGDTHDMRPLFETIINEVPAPNADVDGPLQMQVSALAYSTYVGAIGIGRVHRGGLATGTRVKLVNDEGERAAKVLNVLELKGVERNETDSAIAGQIIGITGIEGIRIGDTLCDPESVEALPALTVEQPTVRLNMYVNDSPFAGKEGKFLTSRQLRERLDRELIHNVALEANDTDSPDTFELAGRGELHLSILLETMRREGYEFAVGPPTVVEREEDGMRMEPFEELSVDVEQDYQGAVMEMIANRLGELTDMRPDSTGRVRLDFIVPSRGLIAFRSTFLTSTAGTGIAHHSFLEYRPRHPGEIKRRFNGVLVSMVNGQALGYALFNLQERGRLFIGPGEQVYEGMLVGIHSRGNDLVVNPTKAKQLTNVRASGSDENIILTPPIEMGLEHALEFLAEDELLEVTPKTLRLRKRLLKEHERKRATKSNAA